MLFHEAPRNFLVKLVHWIDGRWLCWKQSRRSEASRWRFMMMPSPVCHRSHSALLGQCALFGSELGGFLPSNIGIFIGKMSMYQGDGMRYPIFRGIWRCPKIEVPPVTIYGFSIVNNHPAIELGTPMTIRNPPIWRTFFFWPASPWIPMMIHGDGRELGWRVDHITKW